MGKVSINGRELGWTENQATNPLKWDTLKNRGIVVGVILIVELLF